MPLPQLLSILESLGEFQELLSDLPGPAARRALGGLHGSSDAVVLASLSKNLTHRLFVVLNDDVAGAERWLADLMTLVEPEGVAFYPPRESFGEAEAHAEVAGERETPHPSVSPAQSDRRARIRRDGRRSHSVPGPREPHQVAGASGPRTVAATGGIVD